MLLIIAAYHPDVNVFKHVGIDKWKNAIRDGDVTELIVSTPSHPTLPLSFEFVF